MEWFVLGGIVLLTCCLFNSFNSSLVIIPTSLEIGHLSKKVLLPTAFQNLELSA